MHTFVRLESVRSDVPMHRSETVGHVTLRVGMSTGTVMIHHQGVLVWILQIPSIMAPCRRSMFVLSVELINVCDDIIDEFVPFFTDT